MICGFFGSSSTQAGYRLIFSTEGNAVGKVVRWFGDVGRQIEVGTLKELTRRNIVKHEIIRFHYCVFQYYRSLKTERYVGVRVVSLLTLTYFYQGVRFEVVLKYGNGDISRSSWVSTRSKDGLARLADHYFENPQHKNLLLWIITIMNKLRKSVRHGITEVAHLVTGCPWHMRFPRPSVFLPKTSNPARTSWGGILEESWVIGE